MALSNRRKLANAWRVVLFGAAGAAFAAALVFGLGFLADFKRVPALESTTESGVGNGDGRLVLDNFVFGDTRIDFERIAKRIESEVSHLVADEAGRSPDRDPIWSALMAHYGDFASSRFAVRYLNYISNYDACLIEMAKSGRIRSFIRIIACQADELNTISIVEDDPEHQAATLPIAMQLSDSSIYSGSWSIITRERVGVTSTGSVGRQIGALPTNFIRLTWEELKGEFQLDRDETDLSGKLPEYPITSENFRPGWGTCLLTWVEDGNVHRCILTPNEAKSIWGSLVVLTAHQTFSDSEFPAEVLRDPQWKSPFKWNSLFKLLQ